MEPEKKELAIDGGILNTLLALVKTFGLPFVLMGVGMYVLYNQNTAANDRLLLEYKEVKTENMRLINVNTELRIQNSELQNKLNILASENALLKAKNN